MPSKGGKRGPGRKTSAKRVVKPQRKPFLLRLPPDLMDELRTWANRDFRSLNSQIEYLLRQSVARRKGD